ncbi:anthranilate synthase component II [Gilvimarinus xylanilyticus]|uniref:Aminodeoxychorismate/anthranilate synthase component II n=1 Tax=Gilvimarinus xylanilyticus TaxID=2944139 RepID=A0A9X2I4L7_9GAMM|nr:aminodeoxychorismate/anthranilate synthase component II [Gilvimarinus xylanilyticus]MCP8899347.1 aminodeoxychorismate/anthranilate synthase component II [Gilvimarinus xylanilyticus]
MLLMIDNYDSFTYNLVHYFEALGVPVSVHRNDAITLQQIADWAPQYLVISPGPGKPVDAGISLEVIRRFSGKIPLLGVCLGHQSIAEAFGARVVKAERVMHGKACAVSHSGAGVFVGLSQPLEVIRYHSLVVQPESLPNAFEITATANAPSGTPEIMGIRHRSWALEGVQFHPESVKTAQGHALLRNFLHSGQASNRGE